MNTETTIATTATSEVITDSTIDTNQQLAPMEIQTADTIQPVMPSFMTAEEDKEIKQQAQTLAESILANPSDVAITAELYQLGKPAMDTNTKHISLMDTQISTVMGEITVESPVAQSLTQIKSNLDLINPHVVGSKESEFTKKFLWIIPWTVKRLPKSAEIMEMINKNKDTVSETVNDLKKHLWTERDKALFNATELGQLSDNLFNTQEDLQKAAYQGQLMWEILNVARKNETNQVKSQALTYLVNDLSTLVIDLQTVDQLNIQSRLGAENLINNARQIQKLVGRVTDILLPSVQNALAVKAAAAQQAQLVESAAGIMDAASTTIRQTAEDVRKTTVTTAKMNSQSMLRVDDIQAAVNEYELAQVELLEIFKKSEEDARKISNTLTDVNSRMRSHADPLTKARQAKEAAGV